MTQLVIICTGVAIAVAIIYGLSLYDPIPWLEDRKDDDGKTDDPKTGKSEGGR